ncbi:MAG: glutathione S-transferase [Candidatus Azotimanducaceae bacterium]|jgi:glutathione S-transferase
MEIISGVLSNNAAKVRLVLGEKGLDCEIIEVPWTKENAWEPRPAQLLEKNPRAEVPGLMGGDLTLWDSTVIAEYLEDKYPAAPLMPRYLLSMAG